MLATALLGLAVVAFGAGSFASRPASLAAASAALPATVARARALAESSGDGATLTFAPSASGFVATLYPHRPVAGSSFSVATIEQTEAFRVYLASSSAGTSPFAVFLSSSGSTSWAAWTPTDGSLAAEPACDAPLELVMGPSAQAVALAPLAKPSPVPAALAWFTLTCQDATLLQS